MNRTGRGSTRPGVRAPLPSGAYAPSSVQRVSSAGNPVVEFEGEDGRRRTFDFAQCPLPGWHPVLAEVLARRVGPAGGLRTSTSSLAAWNNLRAFLRFLEARSDCPGDPSALTTLTPTPLRRLAGRARSMALAERITCGGCCGWSRPPA
ncbi:hypothetical protein [Micromonospora sp. CPCC 205556]|uniref:hypothetical protein n=1 Tax=Micromonospora sp. CPCC 205556 TaxID=3122398 RepID=UPI002FEEE97D